jgi:hypothetical protein
MRGPGSHPSEKEADGGYEEGHGYGPGHGGPTGPGDAPAKKEPDAPPPPDDDDEDDEDLRHGRDRGAQERHTGAFATT